MKVDMLFFVPSEDSIPRRRSLVLKIRIICLLTKARMSAISLKYLMTFALISALSPWVFGAMSSPF